MDIQTAVASIEQLIDFRHTELGREAWQTLKTAVLTRVCQSDAMTIIREIYPLHRDILNKLGDLEDAVIRSVNSDHAAALKDLSAWMTYRDDLLSTKDKMDLQSIIQRLNSGIDAAH